MDYKKFATIGDDEDDDDFEKEEFTVLTLCEKRRADINDEFSAIIPNPPKLKSFAAAYHGIVSELSKVKYSDRTKSRASNLAVCCLMNALSCWSETQSWEKVLTICDELMNGKHINGDQTFRLLTYYQSAKVRLSMILVNFKTIPICSLSVTNLQKHIADLQSIVSSTKSMPTSEIDLCRSMISAYEKRLAELSDTQSSPNRTDLTVRSGSSKYSANLVSFLQLVVKKMQEGSFSEDALVAMANMSIIESAESRSNPGYNANSCCLAERSIFIDPMCKMLHACLDESKSIEANNVLLQLYRLLSGESSERIDWLYYCAYHYRQSVSCKDYKSVPQLFGQTTILTSY